MNKKILSLVLLSTVAVPGCCFKKKPKCQESSTEDSSYKKGTNAKTFSEEAEEFVLEDDAAVNVFEDNGGVKANSDLSWDNMDEGTSVKTETVQFDFDSSKVNSSEKEKIKRNAQSIKKELNKNPKSGVVVKGHSCKIAKNKEYNYSLSQERAEKVAKVYENEGISRDKIKSVGFGSSMLLTDEDGMEAQAPNRRAETVVLEA